MTRPDGIAAVATPPTGIPVATPAPTWLPTEGVAAYTHRTVYAVRRSAVSGELHGHQPLRDGKPLRKGKWTFHVAAVDAWLRGQDVRAQAIACGCVAVGARHRQARS